MSILQIKWIIISWVLFFVLAPIAIAMDSNRIAIIAIAVLLLGPVPNSIEKGGKVNDTDNTGQ